MEQSNDKRSRMNTASHAVVKILALFSLLFTGFQLSDHTRLSWAIGIAAVGLFFFVTAYWEFGKLLRFLFLLILTLCWIFYSVLLVMAQYGIVVCITPLIYPESYTFCSIHFPNGQVISKVIPNWLNGIAYYIANHRVLTLGDFALITITLLLLLLKWTMFCQPDFEVSLKTTIRKLISAGEKALISGLQTRLSRYSRTKSWHTHIGDTREKESKKRRAKGDFL